MTQLWQLMTHRRLLPDDVSPPLHRRGIRRAVVVGVPGSGKTTFARSLATLLAVPHVELDAIHWSTGNWVELPLTEFRRQVALAAASDSWVVDGNYGKVRDLVWSQADTIIWLDLSLALCVLRLLWRTLPRAWKREVLGAATRRASECRLPPATPSSSTRCARTGDARCNTPPC
ncbi:MAG: hypothetical protein CL878_14080 [Dehalococcoidia bacterium]|nr:hypothetical protein [Dehalococcoidia bacterium]